MQTLFYGGHILTMDEPEYTDAVLVENGKILALGDREKLGKIAPRCKKVDLKGAAMLPGFVDAHSHFLQMALSFLRVPLNGADSSEEIKKRIAAFVEENHVKPGQWIACRDYDNNVMKDLRNPTLAELDDMAPQNPLVIHHKSGHMGLMNSKALEILGVTPDTPDPAGGRIEKVNGKLTGYMEENAFISTIKKIPMLEPEQIPGILQKAQSAYASFGITTMQDGMVVTMMMPVYEELIREGILNQDLVLYASPEDYGKVCQILGKYPENHHIKCGGMKIFLDGSPQGRTAWMREPYAGEETYCAYGTMTDEQVEAAFEAAAKENTQILAHCNGDAAAAQFLRCLEKVEVKYPQLKTLRPVIIHGQLMGRDQIQKAKELGAVISFFVAHVYHWGDVHIRNFGMERANYISPVRSAMEQKINVTFHQDSPVIDPDMLETMWCAVNRITKNGVQLGAEERVSAEDALRAVTVNGAYQYFMEKRIGSISLGKKADFVILDKDPLETAPDKIREIRVLATYKEGKCIYEAK